MGLNITLQSYNGWLDFGLISCQKLMPDISELAQHMKEAHKKLLQLSLKAAEKSTDKIEEKKPVNIESGKVEEITTLKEAK